MNTSYSMYLALLLGFFTAAIQICAQHKQKPVSNKAMAFCTAADEKFFPLVINLIGSIHKANFNDLREIAVFNLGFTQDQINALNSIKKVKVYDIELTHPDLLTPFEVRPNKIARGWYAWKPVVIKQALDMFPQVLYVDAGVVILKPLNNLFKHIEQNGYFLRNCGHNIKCMVIQRIIKKFDLHVKERKWILDENTYGATAAIMGFTRKVYRDLVLPWHEITKDLDNFIDDGSAAGGFGAARYEQAILSVLACLLGLHIYICSPTQSYPIYLKIDNKKVPFYITKRPNEVTQETAICQMRWKQVPDFRKYIRYTS